MVGPALACDHPVLTEEVLMPNADSSMKVVDVPLDQIFHDEKFNCRGAIPTSDVIPLAADIREMGLLHPITLQPWSLAPGKS
jgi:hypothetical protein